MRNLNEETITKAVLERVASSTNPRLKTVFDALVRHLHDFAREVQLTESEWLEGINFLTQTGQTCTATRQEFILLSDTLGLSMLVTAQNHRKPEGCTEATVFGPFHVEGAPQYPAGADISNGAPGQACFVDVTVKDMSGQPIEGALAEVWQSDAEGKYDVQYGANYGHRARGCLRSDATGRIHFKSVLAEAYPIPDDGPVGRMLKALGRHPWRPAHLHFMISAPGFERLVTHVFRDADKYLDSDAVFGVRSSLIAPWQMHEKGIMPDGRTSDAPFYTLHYGFVLNRAADTEDRARIMTNGDLGADHDALESVAGPQSIAWHEAGADRSAQWRSESIGKPPARVQVVDDRITADKAYTLACEGTALLWRGDFQNARQLVNAMARRADRKKVREPADLPEAFRFHRQEQAQRARTLNMLLLQIEADQSIHLRRAPDVADALNEAFGAASARYVLPMRELLGLIGAHEWRSKGIPIPFLRGNIHPHYGVFAPIRHDYLELIENAPLKPVKLAFDIGTGTGILALALARRGVAKVVATDIDPRALACAKENVARFSMQERIDVVSHDMFPAGQADLIVCNPPWLPARPSSSLERAVYDPKSQMLRAFLAGVAEHLLPHGEAWLVLSDLAERLGLRTQTELKDLIETSGLVVVAQLTTRAKHKKALDPADPLHAARSAEVTSLWRLQKK